MKKLITILSIIALTSCTSNLGRFSAISTDNIRGLGYDAESRSELVKVEGKSCHHRFYITRTALAIFIVPAFMPSLDVIIGVKDDRISDSVKAAIENGKDKGLFNGDIVVNVKTYKKDTIVPFFYGYSCVITEGDLVSSINQKHAL